MTLNINSDFIEQFLLDNNRSKQSLISFELCPNRSIDFDLLKQLKPAFCSVAWLSDNVPNEALDLNEQLDQSGFLTILHLPATRLSMESIIEILYRMKANGRRHIFTLQGDGITGNAATHFQYANDMIKCIRQRFGGFFRIGVAAYPDLHPRSKNVHSDLYFLKQKIETGADFIITQGCFHYDQFEYFLNNLKTHHIEIPLIVGVFIIKSYKSLKAMEKFCSLRIPDDIMLIVENNRENNEAVLNFGLFLAENFIKKAFSDVDHCFVRGVHLFTLNDLSCTQILMQRLGFFPTIPRPFVPISNNKIAG